MTTNSQVAHFWANQSRASARSGNGNFWYRDETIYSYGTPIARLLRDELGEIVAVLRTTETYSVTTTGKHENAIHRALRGGLPQIYVPWIADGEGVEDDNLDSFGERIVAHAGKARRARQAFEFEWGTVRRMVVMGNHYRRLIGRMDYPEFAMPDGWEAECAASRARLERYENPDPASLDKRERARAKRLAAKRLAAKRAAEATALDLAQKIDAWKSGLDVYLPWGAPMLLRLQPGHPDVLETSKGARVPLEHAKRIFAMAINCRKTAFRWTPPGLCKPQVGDFHLDCIDADGTIHAGCHVIPWEESARFAASIGIETN